MTKKEGARGDWVEILMAAAIPTPGLGLEMQRLLAASQEQVHIADFLWFVAKPLNQRSARRQANALTPLSLISHQALTPSQVVRDLK